MRRRSMTGFSLLELLMSVAVVGIVMFGISALFNLLASSNANLQSQTGRDNIRSALINAFDHSTLCFNTLNGAGNATVFNAAQATSTTGLPLNLTLDSGSTFITSGNPAAVPAPTPQPLPKYNITYTYFTFKNAQNIGPDPNTAGNILYEGSVVMQVNKLGPAAILGGSAMPVQTVGSLTMSVNPTTNNISSCVSATTVVSGACNNLGGVQNAAPGPGQGQCQLNSPCPTGQIFAGGICVPPTTCTSNQGLAPNAAGVLVCTNL